MENNVEIIKSLHAAFASGDRELAFSYIANDAIWISDTIGAPWSGTFNGIEEIKQHFIKAASNIKADDGYNSKFLNQKFVDIDGMVLEMGNLHVKFIHNNKSYTDEYICRYKIKDSKIIEFKVFEDSYALYLAYNS